jgi:ABC-type glycerol-3-phosphate transport system permease component
MNRKYNVSKALKVPTLIAILLVTFLPMFWMIISSFKTEAEIYQDKPTWLPAHPTLANYASLFTQFGFGRLTLNSLAIVVGVVAISLLFGMMAAYGFSRYRFKGSGIILGALLMTRMVTPASLVLPLYTLMRYLGLLNSLISIIIGITVLNIPFVVWMMKPFFDQLPHEIEEAAEVEGLSPIGVFWKIAIPMASPGVYSILLFSFVAGWVDLLFGMTFSTTPQAMPLTAGLMQMQTGYKIYWGSLMAGGVYLSLPTLVLAFFFQRSLVNGLRVTT